MRLAFNVGQYDNDTAFQRDLTASKAIAKGSTIRLDAVWGYTETSPGHYNWTDIDRRVTETLARDLKILLVIPAWPPAFRLNGQTDKTQLTDDGSVYAYVAFVNALITRYRTQIAGVELGNEPNLKIPFAPDGSKPLFQAHLSDLVAPLIPKGIKVVTPGLAPAVTGSGYYAPLDFLNIYWPALAGDTRTRIDAVGIHPYGRAGDVDEGWSTLGAIPEIHALTSKRLWATEYNSDWNDSDARKATEVPLGLTWMNDLGYVDYAFIYSMSDKPTDSGVRLGMLNADGTHRPLYDSVKKWGKSMPAEFDCGCKGSHHCPKIKGMEGEYGGLNENSLVIKAKKITGQKYLPAGVYVAQFSPNYHFRNDGTGGFTEIDVITLIKANDADRPAPKGPVCDGFHMTRLLTDEILDEITTLLGTASNKWFTLYNHEDGVLTGTEFWTRAGITDVKAELLAAQDDAGW